MTLLSLYVELNTYIHDDVVVVVVMVSPAQPWGPSPRSKDGKADICTHTGVSLGTV